MAKARMRTKTLSGPAGSWSQAQGRVGVPSGAWLSAQAFVAAARPHIDAILRGREIRMEQHNRLLVLALYDAKSGRPAPILARDFIEALRATGANVSRMEATAKKKGFDRVKVARVSVLTNTSKMGCYSFNLPAGPIGTDVGGGGTCPSANIAFMHQTPLAIQHGIARLNEAYIEGKHGAGDILRRANPLRPLTERQERYLNDPKGLLRYPDGVDSFICNGCYALKGAYGNPSILFCMQVRLNWVQRELRSGRLARQLVTAIKAGQVESKRRLDRLQKDVKRAIDRDDAPERMRRLVQLAFEIPNPDYFRIHDAGDLFSSAYAGAWWDVCRALPKVTFWAPTRTWARGSLPEKTLAAIPRNLTLRPSALGFADPSPAVTPQRTKAGGGYAAGSGSGPPNYDQSADVWPCPAYMHTSKGGGASYSGVEVDEAGVVTPKGPLSGGTCARARVRMTPQGPVLDPGGDQECRACWLFPGHHVIYQEH